MYILRRLDLPIRATKAETWAPFEDRVLFVNYTYLEGRQVLSGPHPKFDIWREIGKLPLFHQAIKEDRERRRFRYSYHLQHRWENSKHLGGGWEPKHDVLLANVEHWKDFKQAWINGLGEKFDKETNGKEYTEEDCELRLLMLRSGEVTEEYSLAARDAQRERRTQEEQHGGAQGETGASEPPNSHRETLVVDDSETLAPDLLSAAIADEHDGRPLSERILDRLG